MPIAALNRHQSTVHCLVLVVFSAALFLPMMGRGFILDDFGHLFVAQHESVRFGLMHSSGGPYYAPLAWLSFRIDWMLWGFRPYMWAMTNLILHICNTLLLYALAMRLWRSRAAGWWTAFGFAILYPATVVAMLFIATRAHLMTALFYLVALHSILYFVRAEQFRLTYWLATMAAGTLAMFSKESGATVIAAAAIVILYEHLAFDRRKRVFAVSSLFVGLFAVLAVYLFLRSQSGATPVSFSGPACCSYQPSVKVLVVNALEYVKRTYGLLAFPGLAISISMLVRRRKMDIRSLGKYDFLLSVTLFATAVAPIILLRDVQGIYSYVPGIGASLMLGLLVRQFDDSDTTSSVLSVAAVPIILVVASFVALTVKSGSKWVQLAEVNSAVLQQIKVQQPSVPSDTFVVLKYSKLDLKNRFPEGFGDWCFPYALRVIYGDRTLDGAIVREGELAPAARKAYEVRFSYVEGEAPIVLKTAGLSTR